MNDLTTIELPIADTRKLASRFISKGYWFEVKVAPNGNRFMRFSSAINTERDKMFFNLAYSLTDWK